MAKRLGKIFSTQLSFLGVDVIEYTRRRGFLETLAPSPFKETAFEFLEQLSPTLTLKEAFSYGRRDADTLTRSVYSVGADLPRFFNRRIDVYGRLGYRNNFVSNDMFLRLGGGYYSNQWELSLDTELASETYKNGNPNLHPLTTEVNYARYFSKMLYGSVSVQGAFNETVSVWSSFVKLGYRFGNQEIPPIRDGAPPRGRL